MDFLQNNVPHHVAQVQAHMRRYTLVCQTNEAPEPSEVEVLLASLQGDQPTIARNGLVSQQKLMGILIDK